MSHFPLLVIGFTIAPAIMSLCRSKLARSGWYNDTRGLQYMVIHVSVCYHLLSKTYWQDIGLILGQLLGMSLRNELRSPSDKPTLISEGHKCADWYTNVITASGLIKKKAPTFWFSCQASVTIFILSKFLLEPRSGTITSSRRAALLMRIKLSWNFITMTAQLPAVVVWEAPFVEMDSVHSIRAAPL